MCVTASQSHVTCACYLCLSADFWPVSALIWAIYILFKIIYYLDSIYAKIPLNFDFFSLRFITLSYQATKIGDCMIKKQTKNIWKLIFRFYSIKAFFWYIISSVDMLKVIYLMYFTLLGKSCDLTQWTEQNASFCWWGQ